MSCKASNAQLQFYAGQSHAPVWTRQSGGLYPQLDAAFPAGTCSLADPETSANLNQGCMRPVQRQESERISKQAALVGMSCVNLQLSHDQIIHLVLGQ